MAIQNVGVIGCGLMGHGIAQVAAGGGHEVTVVESDAAALEKGLQRIRGSLAKLVEKGKLRAEDATAVNNRIHPSTKLSDLAGADLVVEAIVEDLDAKKKLFAELGRITKPQAILASNTSSFPIAEMGDASGRPGRMVGLHFFNPVQLMALVEVVRTPKTEESAFRDALEFGKRCGKAPISAKDTPGFVVNRLLVPYILEAIRMVERGDATPEDIDVAMEKGCNFPMGPIKLLDYVGLDTTLLIAEGWEKRYPQEPLFKVPSKLRQLVKEGRLGRKSGRGFFEWEGDKPKARA
ncbi:MAG TPA: 3-hydroxyacyl-CoA dehydrogenase family protein [Planctomycetota bacterium]|nr:3-hydroxyacyl-CoA dehydrogenase family protein [Planctomycetota bacterium]